MIYLPRKEKDDIPTNVEFIYNLTKIISVVISIAGFILLAMESINKYTDSYISVILLITGSVLYFISKLIYYYFNKLTQVKITTEKGRKFYYQDWN